MGCARVPRATPRTHLCGGAAAGAPRYPSTMHAIAAHTSCVVHHSEQRQQCARCAAGHPQHLSCAGCVAKHGARAWWRPRRPHRLNSFLDHVDVGEYIVEGDLEAYSCERVQAQTARRRVQHTRSSARPAPPQAHAAARLLGAWHDAGALPPPWRRRQTSGPGQEAVAQPGPGGGADCRAGVQPARALALARGAADRRGEVRGKQPWRRASGRCCCVPLQHGARAHGDAPLVFVRPCVFVCTSDTQLLPAPAAPAAACARRHTAARRSSTSSSRSTTSTRTTTFPSCARTTSRRSRASPRLRRPWTRTCWRCQRCAWVCVCGWVGGCVCCVCVWWVVVGGGPRWVYLCVLGGVLCVAVVQGGVLRRVAWLVP
jgi:hypothetical protein